MPNHVSNHVTIFGTADRIKAFRESVRTIEADGTINHFDFNKVVPMPKELEGTRSPMQIISEEEYKEQEAKIAKGDLDDIQKVMGVSRSLTLWMSQQYKRKFGADNWYDWCCENWGTKWGSYETSDMDNPDGSFISFQTAWAHPEVLFKRMSELYPDLAFVCLYADEDMGSNCGISAYRNGIFQTMDAEEVDEPMFSTAFAYVVNYGADFENILQEYVDDECMSEEDMQETIKASESAHPMMRLAWRLRGSEPALLGEVGKYLE